MRVHGVRSNSGCRAANRGVEQLLVSRNCQGHDGFGCRVLSVGSMRPLAASKRKTEMSLSIAFDTKTE